MPYPYKKEIIQMHYNWGNSEHRQLNKHTQNVPSWRKQQVVLLHLALQSGVKLSYLATTVFTVHFITQNTVIGNFIHKRPQNLRDMKTQ